MITEEQAEKAANFIYTNAAPYAEAKSNRRYLEEFRKTQKAILASKASGTILERESYAYAHPDYIQVIDGLREAIKTEETLFWQMKSAVIKTELWRSQSANNRNTDKAHR